MSASHRVLVINPNSSISVTQTIKAGIDKLDICNLDISYWTSPDSPALIKNAIDMEESTALCLPFLLPLIKEYDGFLAACYADHPIVATLQICAGTKPVVGIFDASVTAALSSIASSTTSKFGILTTGKPFEPLLNDGVTRLFGNRRELMCRFAGVFASGIGVGDLQSGSAHLAQAKIAEAVSEILVNQDIQVICLGGAILSGLEHHVFEVAKSWDRDIEVVDQLAAGMKLLQFRLQQSIPSKDVTVTPYSYLAVATTPAIRSLLFAPA